MLEVCTLLAVLVASPTAKCDVGWAMMLRLGHQASKVSSVPCWFEADAIMRVGAIAAACCCSI
jgi:hypothetical protein